MRKQALSVIGFFFLLSLLSGYTVHADENPKLQFGVISDVHITTNDEFGRVNFIRALNDLKSVAPDYNALAIVGDLTDWGLSEEYDQFNSILQQYKLPAAQQFITMGNHEYFEMLLDQNSIITDKDLQQRFEQKENVPKIYYDKWVEGYHFITLSGEKSYTTLQKEVGAPDNVVFEAYFSDEQLNWFKKTIAKNADPNKPIFVFLHQPLINTVYGSEWGTDYAEQELASIMEKYPQIIFFTGHSHYPISNPRSILKKGITFVNTGSVAYIYDDNQIIPDLSEGYLIKVYSDRVEIKAREFSNSTWINTFTISNNGGYRSENTGWVSSNGKMYYVNACGEIETGWQYIEGNWYYMDASGVMQTGWQYFNGSWYFLNASGVMQTGSQYIGGSWYYLNASGVMQTGWQYFNGSWYFLNSSGVMQTGLQYISGSWYYLNASGVMQTGWQYFNGSWYYLNASGVMQTGWQYFNGSWYYLNASGVMQTGWQYFNRSWYFLNDSGVMQTGWQYFNGSWYFLNDSGVMQTGWQYINRSWYYLNASGIMQTGWQYVNNKWYYINSPNGVMQTGWLLYQNRWYYLKEDGSMAIYTVKIGTITYSFAASGELIS